MKKIAFDFDGTLEFADVQELAKKLIDMGHHVEIVTTRWDEENKHKYPFFNVYPKDMQDNLHADLYAVSEELNIPINFTNMEWKGKFLKEHNFDILIDDNYEEEVYAKENGIEFIYSRYNNKGIKSLIKRLKKDGEVQN